MLVAVSCFVWFLAACLWTVNALRRPVPPGGRFPPLWLPGMIVSELAPWYLVVRGLIAWGFVAGGALDVRIGQVGIALFVLSELGLLVLIGRSVRAARNAGQRPGVLDVLRVTRRLPDGVTLTREIPYCEGFTLDAYRHPTATAAPALVYLHPGSWMRGRPGRQALHLFYQLAAAGWVILDIRYPLSPRATFPEHLIGVKRAIAWAKEGAPIGAPSAMGVGGPPSQSDEASAEEPSATAEERPPIGGRSEDGGGALGIDPANVAIAGASSGAHLAALAALTWDHADLQPGFEQADTSVVACVPHYGIYDLLVRNATRYDWPFIALHVMKARPDEDPDLYRLGSPLDLVRPDAPPFLVIHGEYDSAVLAGESRHLVEALRRCGAPVEYHEVAGAQHGFDAIASVRTRAVGDLVAAFLRRVVRTRA